jgi:hypothetical protein
LIVVVGKTKSTLASTGVTLLIQSIVVILVVKTVPYPIPKLLANSIVTNVSVLSPFAFFLKCK